METNTITLSRSPWCGGKSAGTTVVVTYTGEAIPFSTAEWAAERGGEVWVHTPGFTNASHDPGSGRPYSRRFKPGRERSVIEKENIVAFEIIAG